MPKQSKQKKFLFDNKAARETTSPFTVDRNKIIDNERKELPIGRNVKIELTTHRHPLEGELVLTLCPLVAKIQSLHLRLVAWSLREMKY